MVRSAAIALGPVSISEKTSFRKISLSLETARLVFRIVRSLWNLTGTSAALLPMCLSNFKAIRRFKVQISWLRDFTRSYEETYFRILRRCPGSMVRGANMGPIWSRQDPAGPHVGLMNFANGEVLIESYTKITIKNLSNSLVTMFCRLCHQRIVTAGKTNSCLTALCFIFTLWATYT